MNLKNRPKICSNRRNAFRTIVPSFVALGVFFVASLTQPQIIKATEFTEDVTVNGALVVDQNLAATGLLVTGGNGGHNIAAFVRDVGADGSIAFNVGGHDPRMVLDSGPGSVPWHVGVDDFPSDSFKIGHSGSPSNGENVLCLTTTGKMGVGKTDPTEALDVDGNIALTGTIIMQPQGDIPMFGQ